MGLFSKIRKGFKNLGKWTKKTTKKFGKWTKKTVKNGGKWIKKNAHKAVKVVGSVAKIVGTVAQVIPVVGQVAGGALIAGGALASKAAKKLEPVLKSVDNVKKVLGESRLNKMVTAVNKKGYVNTSSIKNTLIAKGIPAEPVIINDVKNVLKSVSEVVKETEKAVTDGVDVKVKVPVTAKTTKSSPVRPLASAEKVAENQAKAAKVYGIKKGTLAWIGGGIAALLGAVVLIAKRR